LRSRSLIVAGFLAAAAGAWAAVPQASPEASQQPSFPAEVELVEVDVVVADREGRPVRGLTRDDFTVEEDGQPQAIESFEAVVTPSEEGPVAAAPPPRVSTNEERIEEARRTFLIVFDDLNLTRLQTIPAKAAVAEFLRNGVGEGDRVLFVATGRTAWWSARMEAGREGILAQLKGLEGLRRVDTEPDRMTDWEALRIHVYRDREVAARVGRRFKEYGVTPAADVKRVEYRFTFEDPYLLQRASQVYMQALERNRLTLGLLERGLQALDATPGRKSAILVSEGFVRDPTLREFKEVVEASRRSNVALYFVDARGLTGMPLAATAEFGPPLVPEDMSAMSLDDPLASEGSETLAAETGGFTVKNTNDLAEGIKRISRESEAYYMLGYRPPRTPLDGRFHEIDVKVRKKGVRVRARRGYYALEPTVDDTASGATEPPGFQRALDSLAPMDGIPLRMTALVFREQVVGRADVLVAASVDVHDLAFERLEGRLADELQTLLVLVHRESGEVHRQDQAVELSFRPEALEALQKSGYMIARTLQLAPGGYHAKLVVRDGNGTRIGTVAHSFEVPELEGFRISTPLLTDTVQGARGERPRPVLQLRRRFSPEATLYCEYEVYQAARDRDTGMPRVVAGYEIRRTDGAVLSRVEPTLIRPSSLGEASRLIVAPLWRIPPGQYELVLQLRDEIAGRDLEVREPFEVGAPDADSATRHVPAAPT
jgi:VWFA-related protein